MNELIVVGVVLVVTAAVLSGLRSARRKRRAALLSCRYSNEQRSELVEDFPLFGRLPEALRDELEGLMHVFVEEKAFEACGGLEQVTPHMQRVIAAQACLLLLNREHDLYESLRTILVYPGAYRAQGMHGAEDVRLGESWGQGSVVLSWSSVVAGSQNEEDGHHVSIHEFAHQLDQADGSADGVPELETRGAYREWAQVFSASYEYFTKRVDSGKRTVLDDYGAENPAEFFAVATETFYEKPRQLKKSYPALYEQLSKYYRVDPVEWL